MPVTTTNIFKSCANRRFGSNQSTNLYIVVPRTPIMTAWNKMYMMPHLIVGLHDTSPNGACFRGPVEVGNRHQNKG